MKNKILLQENENLAKSVINLEESTAKSFKNLLELLEGCGLKLSKVDSWEEIETKIKQKFQFPNASIDFNLESLGIKELFYNAKKLYDEKLRGCVFIDKVTPERIEEIKESKRVYATSQNQVDAINTARSIVESVTKLNSLGIRIDVNGILDSSSIFSSDARGTIRINERNLFTDVIRIK